MSCADSEHSCAMNYVDVDWKLLEVGGGSEIEEGGVVTRPS